MLFCPGVIVGEKLVIHFRIINWGWYLGSLELNVWIVTVDMISSFYPGLFGIVTFLKWKTKFDVIKVILSAEIYRDGSSCPRVIQSGFLLFQAKKVSFWLSPISTLMGLAPSLLWLVIFLIFSANWCKNVIVPICIIWGNGWQHLTKIWGEFSLYE